MAGPSSNCPLASPAGPLPPGAGGAVIVALARRQEALIPFTNVVERLRVVFIRQGCCEVGVCAIEASLGSDRREKRFISSLGLVPLTLYLAWPEGSLHAEPDRTKVQSKSLQARCPQPGSSSHGRRRKSSEAKQEPCSKSHKTIAPAAARRGCSLARSVPQQASQSMDPVARRIQSRLLISSTRPHMDRPP